MSDFILQNLCSMFLLKFLICIESFSFLYFCDMNLKQMIVKMAYIKGGK